MKVEVFGTPDSVYTRIVRLALHAKAIDYCLVMADIFDDRGLPEHYEALHPFGRIPALRIDGIELFETDAIVHYLEASRPFPPLVPGDAIVAARMRQIMRVVDHYAYRPLVWGIYVPIWWRDGQTPTGDAIAQSRRALAVLAGLVAATPSAVETTLATFYLAAILAVADSVAMGTALIDEATALRAWWSRIRQDLAMILTRSEQSRY